MFVVKHDHPPTCTASQIYEPLLTDIVESGLQPDAMDGCLSLFPFNIFVLICRFLADAARDCALLTTAHCVRFTEFMSALGFSLAEEVGYGSTNPEPQINPPTPVLGDFVAQCSPTQDNASGFLGLPRQPSLRRRTGVHGIKEVTDLRIKGPDCLPESCHEVSQGIREGSIWPFSNSDCLALSCLLGEILFLHYSQYSP